MLFSFFKLRKVSSNIYLLLIFFKDFIYLFMRDRQRPRQREKQVPCREPDVGLDPKTPGSQTEPKADVQPLSHQAPWNLEF